MRVLFVRHAEAEVASEGEGGDLDRPLTGKGRRTSKTVARGLARRFDQPDHIFSSTAERARATAEKIAQAFGGLAVEEKPDLNPGAQPAAYLRLLAEAWKREDALLILVGHEPDLSTVVAEVVAGGHLRLKFKKAAVAEVEMSSPSRGMLRALVDHAVWEA